MVFCKISRDVKIAAIKLFEHDLLELHDILHCCGFSERTWYHILKLWRETGDVIKPSQSLHGRLRLLDCDDVDYLLCLINQNPDYFLDELLYLLKTNQFISVNYLTIHHELECAGVSHKKLKHVTLEHDEACCTDFISCMAQYQPEEIRFIDKMSKDERTLGRHYGRSKKGKRAEKKHVYVRGRGTSTEALLTLDGIVAGTMVEGSMTKATFGEYLEFNVVHCSGLSSVIFLTAPCSYLNAQCIQDHSVSLLWTMPGFTMVPKSMSLLIASVCILTSITAFFLYPYS
jgi:transposase